MENVQREEIHTNIYSLENGIFKMWQLSPIPCLFCALAEGATFTLWFLFSIKTRYKQMRSIHPPHQHISFLAGYFGGLMGTPLWETIVSTIQIIVKSTSTHKLFSLCFLHLRKGYLGFVTSGLPLWGQFPISIHSSVTSIQNKSRNVDSSAFICFILFMAVGFVFCISAYEWANVHIDLTWKQNV